MAGVSQSLFHSLKVQLKSSFCGFPISGNIPKLFLTVVFQIVSKLPFFTIVSTAYFYFREWCDLQELFYPYMCTYRLTKTAQNKLWQKMHFEERTFYSLNHLLRLLYQTFRAAFTLATASLALSP